MAAAIAEPVERQGQSGQGGQLGSGRAACLSLLQSRWANPTTKQCLLQALSRPEASPLAPVAGLNISFAWRMRHQARCLLPGHVSFVTRLKLVDWLQDKGAISQACLLRPRFPSTQPVGLELKE